MSGIIEFFKSLYYKLFGDKSQTVNETGSISPVPLEEVKFLRTSEELLDEFGKPHNLTEEDRNKIFTSQGSRKMGVSNDGYDYDEDLELFGEPLNISKEQYPQIVENVQGNNKSIVPDLVPITSVVPNLCSNSDIDSYKENIKLRQGVCDESNNTPEVIDVNSSYLKEPDIVPDNNFENNDMSGSDD